MKYISFTSCTVLPPGPTGLPNRTTWHLYNTSVDYWNTSIISSCGAAFVGSYLSCKRLRVSHGPCGIIFFCNAFSVSMFSCKKNSPCPGPLHVSIFPKPNSCMRGRTRNNFLTQTRPCFVSFCITHWSARYNTLLSSLIWFSSSCAIWVYKLKNTSPNQSCEYR